MNNATIRPLSIRDEDQWLKLWRDYLAFYRATVPDSIAKATFEKLLDEGSRMRSLVAESEGRLVGICNYLFHDSCWSAAQTCYLQDLFVVRSSRGQGTAKALILACEHDALASGADRLYWLTQEYNAPARSLYDTIAQRTSFIVYRKPIQAA
jgi:GNAT superfamily N-acetyltransferase